MIPSPYWRRVVAVAIFIAGTFSTGFVINSLRLDWRTSAASVKKVEQPRTGTQLLMIFVGSSTCGASRYPGLPATLRNIRQLLAEQARRQGKAFVSVGLSVDQDPWIGSEFLKPYGPFDEILSGRGWLNTGAIAFVVRDFPAQRAIPQLILLERDVEVEDSSISTVADRLTGRRIGVREIVSLAHELAELRTDGGSKTPSPGA
jgi:hypothetical protein